MKRTATLIAIFVIALMPITAIAQGGLGISHEPDPDLIVDLQTRRANLLAAMPNDSMAYFISERPKRYSNDVSYEYRQDNDLYYLTGINQENIALVLVKHPDDTTEEVLFLPEREPKEELWTGKTLSITEARARSGITIILPRQELGSFTLNLPGNINYTNILSQMRSRKSAYEIIQLRDATDITGAALSRAMRTTAHGKWEYEIEADIEHTFKSQNAAIGFPSIVASGLNATTLHYEQSQRQMHHGDLLLMDIGAEVNHYTADVTRTIPVNGRFTREQREIYEAVLKAQIAAERILKPGVTLRDLHLTAMNVLGDELLKLGLITQKNPQQISLWFPHGIGHSIGLDVHDGVERGTPLQAGMLITIEPGLYIRDDRLSALPEEFPDREHFLQTARLAVQRYSDIGVRIEDDYLITVDGFERLSKNAPRDPDEIEALMKGERQ